MKLFRQILALSLLLITSVGVISSQDAARKESAPQVLERNVRAEMDFLASDAMQGRGSMTGYERIAAEYIASQFRQFGLEPAGDADASGAPGFVQRVALGSIKYTELPQLRVMNGKETRTWTYGKDFLTSFLRSASTSGALQVTGAEGNLAKGAVVVMTDVPENADRRARQQLISRAYSAGAAAVVMLESEANRRSRETVGASLPSVEMRAGGAAAGADASAGETPFVAITLRKEAFDELSKMPAGTRVEFGGPTEKSEAATWNAIGFLRGTDTNVEAITLTAHLDHLGVGQPVNGDAIYNGADDDASGCVAVLELARALTVAPRPRRSIYFICFGSEERGGYGARYFIDHSPVPLTSIVADLTFEMLGRPDPKVPADTLWLTGYERSNLGPELARQGARLVADPHPEQNFFRRSDNYALAVRGVVAHTVSSFGLHTDYHRPSDEANKIDFQFMTRAINSMIGPIRWLADSTFRPTWLPGQAPKGE